MWESSTKAVFREFSHWGKSGKSQREYTTFGAMFIVPSGSPREMKSWVFDHMLPRYWFYRLQIVDTLVQWTSVAWPTTRSSLWWNILSSVGERLSGNILEQILSFFIHTVWFCAKCLARSDCLDVKIALHWITTLGTSGTLCLSWENSLFPSRGVMCHIYSIWLIIQQAQG